MKGKLWEMVRDELFVKNVLLGRGCYEGVDELSFFFCLVVFWGIRVGWYMVKFEGNTFLLMYLLLLVFIYGI